MHATTLSRADDGRYVFRPWGELALIGSAIALILLAGLWTKVPDARAAGAAQRSMPTLNLSAAGDFQQAVHVNFDAARQDAWRNPAFAAPLHALVVSPRDWVRIYTNSPLGLPRTARARIYRAAPPEPCFGNVMIGCVRVDTRYGAWSIPLHANPVTSFGFAAPAVPGSYWIALQADWEFGGGTQVFLLDVRA